MSTSVATAANLVDTDMLQVKNTLRANGISLKGSKATPEQIDKVAHEFESQFVSQMLTSVFNTESRDELAGSDSEDVYKSMLTTEYGKIIAKTGGIGVADQVKRIMISQQEVER